MKGRPPGGGVQVRGTLTTGETWEAPGPWTPTLHVHPAAQHDHEWDSGQHRAQRPREDTPQPRPSLASLPPLPQSENHSPKGKSTQAQLRPVHWGQLGDGSAILPERNRGPGGAGVVNFKRVTVITAVSRGWRVVPGAQACLARSPPQHSSWVTVEDVGK